MDSDPSQSAELLQHVLAAAPQSQEPIELKKNWDLAPPDDGIDFSLDSRIIPVRPVTPRYHLPPLPLQRSQEDSGEHVLVEDSQKENHRLEDSEEDGTCHIIPPSKIVPVHLGSESGSEVFHQHAGGPAFTASAGKVIGTGSLSFHPPPTIASVHLLSRPAKSMPVGNKQLRRSPSFPSQDSFGGPISQDPAELYLASAKQFNVPLSDLGETPTQEAINPPTDPEMTLPDASEHKEFLEAAMRKYDAEMASRATATRRANILVAATPSEASSMSQHRDDDFSFYNRSLEYGGQERRFEFNGSSSFDKMLDRDLVDVPDPTPEPAQPNEVQPALVDRNADAESSVGNDTLATPLRTSEQCSPPFEWIAPATGTAAASNPRSLLRTEHPGYQYRLAKIRDLGGTVGLPSCVATGPETQPSGVEETQPCHINEPTYSPPHSPARLAHHQTKLTGSRPSTRQPHKKDEDDAPGDALDIVPDSEPLRAGLDIQTPSHHCVTHKCSPTKLFRSFSPISEHESGDFVPDSLEVEESEADIPLVTEVASRNTKPPTEGATVHGRKMRTASALPEKVTPALDKQQQKPIPSSTKGKQPRAKSSKTEIMEVPTSLPEQDLHGQPSSFGKPAVVSTDLLPSGKKRKGLPNLEPSPAVRASTTRLPATKSVAGKKRLRGSDTEGSEDSSHHSTEDECAAYPKVQKEEEEETELADDHDVGSPLPPPKPDTSRKKRRTGDPNPIRGTSKAPTSTRNKWSETPAVATRSVKRLRSGKSSTRGLSAEPPTQVFALWKQDGHYYSGVAHSRGQKNKYLIKFDDGTEDEVELKNIRRRELLVGDRVIAILDGVKCVVGDVNHADSHGWFTLQMDDTEVASTRQAGFPDIRIANRTIQSQWKQRTIVPEDIVTVIRPKPPIDATPSKQSNLSMTSGKVQREFLKTGFVVTINPKNEEPVRTKDVTMRAIKQHGGLVIEDWSSVFTMEGKHCQSNKRWIATPQDFRWNPEVNLDRVFLLSDDAHQKPRFLLALALGIPCISFEWLTREGEFSSDWQQYLLPAGYSDSLSARVSQFVDLDWGNCTEHLTDIMTSRVPFKLFSQKTVLCVGADLVPLPPNRTRKNVSEEPSRYVPWIILCMGATRVEAVTDTKQVPLNHLQAFDYIIVRERGILGSVQPGNAVVADVNWVKDCLVSSRLSPPEPDC